MLQSRIHIILVLFFIFTSIFGQNTEIIDNVLKIKNADFENAIKKHFNNTTEINLVSIYDLNVDLNLLFDSALNEKQFIENISIFSGYNKENISQIVDEILILNNRNEFIGECNISGLEIYNKNRKNSNPYYVPNELVKAIQTKMKNIKIIFQFKEIDFFNYYIVTNSSEVLVYNFRISPKKLLSFKEFKETFRKYSWWRWKIDN